MLLACDLRILPSTDSQSDLVFDESSLPHQSHDVLSANVDERTVGYAPGRAFQRMAFLPPPNSEPLPLTHSVSDSDRHLQDGITDEGCDSGLQQEDTSCHLLPSTSVGHDDGKDTASASGESVSQTRSSVHRDLVADAYSRAKVK